MNGKNAREKWDKFIWFDEFRYLIIKFSVS